MSFWLVALKEKGIEGLLTGVSRCWWWEGGDVSGGALERDGGGRGD